MHLKSTTANNESHHIQLMIFVCLGFLLYFKTFGHTWTFDDYFVILKNQDIRSLKDFINDGYPGRPLRELSFMLDYKLFGLNPKYWHIQNVLIHSINAWLIYVLLMNLSRSKSLSWLSSLLFLAHPIHVEVVANISHRKDSLCLLFILLSFYSYVSFRNNKGLLYLYLSFSFFVFSALAKQTAFAFPVMFVLYEALFNSKKYKIIKNNKYIIYITLTISSALTFFLLYLHYFDKGSRFLLFYSSNVVDGYSISKYFFTVFSAWGFIIAKMFWPFGLAVNYTISPPELLFDYRLVVLALFLIFWVVMAYYSFHKSSLLLFFLFWFVVLFLPTSNVLPFARSIVADRYLYVPSVGLCVAVAFLVISFLPKWHTPLSFLIFCLLSLVTLNQTEIWRNDLSLWENSLRFNPDSSSAIMNVALYKYDENGDQFLKEINSAIIINPYHPFLYNSLASFYYKKNEHRKAIENYEKFLELINRHGVSMYKEMVITARDRLLELKVTVDK